MTATFNHSKLYTPANYAFASVGSGLFSASFNQRVFHNVRGNLANFLHVLGSFVARFHEVKLMEGTRACPTNEVSPATFYVAREL